MNAQDNRDAVPIVQSDNGCDVNSTGRRVLCQGERVLQHAHVQNQGGCDNRTKVKTIKWNEWNPFERATGAALRQLNKRQRKQIALDAEEALL